MYHWRAITIKLLLVVIPQLWAESLKPFSTSLPPFTVTNHPQKPSLGQRPTHTCRWWENLILGEGRSAINPYPYSIKALPDRLKMSLPSPSKTIAEKFVATWFLSGMSLKSMNSFTSKTVTDTDDVSITIEYRTGSFSSYISENGKGDLNFHITLQNDAVLVKVVIDCNQVLISEDDITDSKIQLQGEWVFSFAKSGFNPGDAVRVCFYVIYNDGSVHFFPGSSTDKIWSEFFFVDEPKGVMTVSIVRGSPYITALFEKILPKFITDGSNTIISVNGVATPTQVTTSKLRVVLSGNRGQVWIIYSSVIATFQCMPAGIEAIKNNTIPTDELIIRVAVLPTGIKSEHINTTAETVLDMYSNSSYAVGGKADFDVTGDVATISLLWKTQGFGPLLMMALPHHQIVMPQMPRKPLYYNSIIGDMIAFVGDVWTWEETLTSIKWSAPRSINASLRETIISALQIDQNIDISDSLGPYNYGKGLSGLGRVALIADEVGEEVIANTVRMKMKRGLNIWFKELNENPLLYDQDWGGIVPTKGLGNKYRDYGAGYYNDHHFHYGYFLYGAAALAKEDPSWAMENEEYILALARDIANPSLKDTYFPRFRHFDWYAGHSWASGLFEFGDSRNQESTTEAINAWYGLYLWGLATSNKNVENAGRLLLASEIRGAKTYWHMPNESSIYPLPFNNQKCVGIVWGDKVDAATWFGGSPIFVIGINTLPVTPITEEVFDKEFASELWDRAANELEGHNSFWKSLLLSILAIVDPPTAWTEFMAFNKWITLGISKSNSLYWVSTRP